MNGTPQTSRNAVIIFAKWPELGMSKTRIAAETSARFALEFSTACLADLIANVSNSDYYDLLVGVNTHEELALFRDHYRLSGILTKGDTQGERFHSVFCHLLMKAGYSKVILIPMDLPFLSQEEMIAALIRLNELPYVHGPESNGGIYLMGAKAPYTKDIFRGVRWSSASSFQDLVANCGQENVYVLKQKDDLNSFRSVLNARRTIACNCPVLFQLLVKEGYYLPDDRYIDFDVLPISIPVVTTLVQRQGLDGPELLMQTRWKPSSDPIYTGTLELPSGLVHRHEPAYQAAVRETKEETGLEVELVFPHSGFAPVLQEYKGVRQDAAVAYMPFSGIQQTQGGRAYIGMAFLCNVVGGELRENRDESKHHTWMTIDEVEKVIRERPEAVFTLHIPLLRCYVEYTRRHAEENPYAGANEESTER